jgi:hypothetical protein
MSLLHICARCGGLKREERVDCPHCGLAIPRWRKRIAALLALGGPALVASGCHPIVVEYGFCTLPDGNFCGEAVQICAQDPYQAKCEDAGRDGGHDAGADAGDGGHKDAGPDGG